MILSSNTYKKTFSTIIIKMRTTKSSSSTHKQKKFEYEIINTLGKGITKKLLEKYKPRVLYNMETIISSKEKNRVA